MPRKPLVAIEDLPVAKKLLLVIAAPIILEFIFGLTLNSMIGQAQHELEAELHSKAVILECESVKKGIVNAAFAGLIQTVNRSGFQLSFDRSKQDSLRALANLKELTGTHVDEYASIAPFAADVEAFFREGEVIGRRFVDGGEHLSAFEGLRLRSIIEESTKKTIAAYQKVLQLMERKHALNSKKDFFRKACKNLIFAGIAGNIAAGALLAVFASKALGTRLEQVEHAIAVASSGAQMPAPLEGKDEVAELNRVLYKMVDDLNQLRNREQAIVQYAAEAIFLVSADGTILRANPALLEMCSPATASINSCIFDLLPQSCGGELRFAIQSSTLDGSKKTLETAGFGVDGACNRLLWSVTREPNANNFHCVVHDITDRKRAERYLQESEERLRTLMINLPTGLFLCDETGRIEFANLCATRMFDLPDDQASHIQTSFIEDLIPGVGSEQASNKAVVLDMHSLSGQLVKVELLQSQIFVRSTMKRLILVQDVSDREALEAAKNEFTAVVSEEMKMPLIDVTEVLSLLKGGRFGDLSNEALSTIAKCERESARLLRLIDSLAWSGAENELTLEPEFVKLSVLLEQSIDAVEKLALRRSVSIEPDIPVDVELFADKDKMVQVMVNLLSNAIKYSHRNDVVRLKAIVSSSEISLYVIDSGTGIAVEHQTTIFEKFQQIQDPQGISKQGTGLGLPMAKLIVDAHGGSIAVESRPGKGSTFCVSLPLRKEPCKPVDHSAGDVS
jgi:signal transduction histidine kinase